MLPEIEVVLKKKNFKLTPTFFDINTRSKIEG